MESEASSTTSARPGADGRRTTRTPGWVIIVYLIEAGLLIAATALASSAIALMGSVRNSAGTDAEAALILGFMAKATVAVVLIFVALALGAVAAICHAVGRHERAADDRHQQIPAMLADAYAAGFSTAKAEDAGKIDGLIVRMDRLNVLVQRLDERNVAAAGQVSTKVEQLRQQVAELYVDRLHAPTHNGHTKAYARRGVREDPER